MIPTYTDADAELFMHRWNQSAHTSSPDIVATVQRILLDVRDRGDKALRDYARLFDKSAPEAFLLSQTEVQAACDRVSKETRQLFQLAAENIRAFGAAIRQKATSEVIDRGEFEVGFDFTPVQRVGCYVPGGRFPLPSTALMTAVTAQVAGVPEIVIASPHLKDEVVYAGTLAGVRTFYQIGGAQAIAALTFGTQSISAVDMIVGPGNAYVTEAKRQVQGLVGIDMLAGPSEVIIIADDSANPNWVAWDLLAQAEHDPDARVAVLTPSVALAEAIVAAVSRALEIIDPASCVHQSLPLGGILVLPTLEACIETANRMAPEHLELQVADPLLLKGRLFNYGALFMGHTACAPYGDYITGPNHTLPTCTRARFSGALNPLHFLRVQTWVNVTGPITALANNTAMFAQLEGLLCHAEAARSRVIP